MKHPAYHLRSNKAVDRLTLIEAIKYLRNLGVNLREYTYYTLGGPYLEDCRLIYDFYPEIRMVSVEENEETYKRQEFHLPCGTLELTPDDMSSFIARYDAGDQKSIFWLDYTRLEYANFEDFMALLGKLAPKSMLKVTMRAEPRDYYKRGRAQEFRKRFEAVMPRPAATPPATSEDLAYLVQRMLQIASQKALPSATPFVFQPVSSFYYSDGPNMLTLTGLVCQRDEQNTAKAAFRDMQFSNLDWAKPRLIDLPNLSTKERLHVQRLLPYGAGAGAALRQSLGYLIDEDLPLTEMKLQQYADFHRYFPYFMKAIP
jgi:hypothetical protein